MTVCLEFQDVYGPITTSAPGWTGGGRSIVELDGDFYFGFEVTTASVGVVVGINDTDEGQHYAEILHGFHFSRGEVRIMEQGVAQGSPRTQELPWEADLDEWWYTRYYVVRIGSTILYCERSVDDTASVYYSDPRFPGVQLPGAVLLVSSRSSFGTVFLDSSFYMTGDTILHESYGVTWYPDTEDFNGGEGGLPANSGAVNAPLPPFVVVGSQGLAATAAVGYGELPFEVAADSQQAVMLRGELPFTVLGADIELNSLIIGVLPFEVHADAGGLTVVIEGINGFIPFTVVAGGSIRNAGVDGELPFDVLAVGSQYVEGVYASIFAELPFTALAVATLEDVAYNSGIAGSLAFEVFSTGTEDGETAVTAGIDMELPFAVFGSSRAAGSGEAVFTAGLLGELPFTAFGLGDIVPAVVTAGAFGELPFEVAGVGHFELDPGIAAGIDGELPFAVFGTGTEDGETAVTAGAYVELPFDVFGTCTANGETAVTAGAYVELPFAAFATSQSSTEITITAALYGELPFVAEGFTEPDLDAPPAAILYGELPFSAIGEINYNLENYFNIFLSFTGTEPVVPFEETDIQETLRVLTDDIQVRYVNKQYARIRVTGLTRTFVRYSETLLEDVLTTALQRNALVIKLAEEVEALDTLSLAYIVALADRLVVAGVAQTFYEAVVDIVAAATVSDARTSGGVTGAAYAVRLLGSFAANGPVTTTISRIAALLDEVTAEDALGLVLTIVVEETAALAAADSVELTARLLAELLDYADVYSLIKTPSDLAQGWVMNTEGDMPISEYDNFTFNSLTQYKNKFYGTSDTGLYLMGADDDAGAPITAQLASLMLDFGTSRLKRMLNAYLGYTSANELVLKVRSVSDGVLSEHWYKARPVGTADAPRENRVTIGKGLRSRYWQFELTNVGGGDFEVDQIELYPLVLNRRV